MTVSVSNENSLSSGKKGYRAHLQNKQDEPVLMGTIDIVDEHNYCFTGDTVLEGLRRVDNLREHNRRWLD